MKYPEDKILKVDEARELLEQEFRNRILEKFPDIEPVLFINLVEAFLRGYNKGVAVMNNIYNPDLKLCVFDEDLVIKLKC